MVKKTEATETKKSSFVSTTTSYRPGKKVFLIILIAGVLLLLSFKKSWFIAAMVNNSPITNFELLARLNQQYRSRTINQMVNEKVILDEARKKGVGVKASEIDDKISQLENNVGGKEALDGLLAQQGQTRNDLRNQLRIQLAAEKLYDKEATVSAEEIEEFVKQNKENLQATQAAEQKKEAEEILKQQKLGKIFNEKFQQLKQAANVQIF